MPTNRKILLVKALVVGLALLLGLFIGVTYRAIPNAFSSNDLNQEEQSMAFDSQIAKHSERMFQEGRRTFRFDTFGDEAFWGGTLRLHEAIRTVSPRTALSVGLKVDVGMLPRDLVQALREGKVDLDDPANTLALLRLNSVVGVTGFFDQNGGLRSIGIQCALCHSTVDNSFTAGIGHRLDGWANRDLNVGAIVSLSPNLQPVATLLGVDVDTVRKVLASWGPGKFDAELFLDGKAFRPDGAPAATLLPNAFGLAGFNQHTYTGGWGTVTYWNAFVANIEMHGKGTFFDPRLDDPVQFPIAARNRFGHLRANPNEDRITSKLPALQFYQLAIPAPKARSNVDFDAQAAARGRELFVDKARCNNCHVTPLLTEPGWNVHRAEEIGIDNFQANRSPGKSYKTMNLAGVFVRERGLFMNEANKGRFYHDGRFATLLDVVEHYNEFFGLKLTDQEKSDLVEYLKSL